MKLMIITNIIAVIIGAVSAITLQMLCKHFKLDTKILKNIIARIWFSTCVVVLFILKNLLCCFKHIWFYCLLCAVIFCCYTHLNNAVCFKPINGYSVLFLLMIFLLVYPLISKFKISDCEVQFIDIFKFKNTQEAIDNIIAKLGTNNIKNSRNDIDNLNIEINNLKTIQNGGNNE